ncbi:LysR family transcriptional regulator [Paraburkholderia ferrariae]|uniref:LysR family transcriptional regulator n=1 Tax=Paraburkholderia ferrariae TaxID=386056 RepID=UPI0004878E08|nr:LysR family transcriptional regulator [Paraburkholderia ferrariae]
MSFIDHFNLRTFDLNLLIAFDALMQEKSVTRAATRLRVHQPAMSHSLATLRLLLDDQLFVRVGVSMEPTAKATAMAASVRTMLQDVQRTLASQGQFEPSHSERTFRIALTGELEVLMLPVLLAKLKNSAPSVRFIAQSVCSRSQARRLLDSGEVDLAIGCFSEFDPWHKRELLFDETLVCCFNRHLLQLSLPVDVDAYVRTPHVLTSFDTKLQGCFEDILTNLGVKLNVTCAAPNFLAVLTMLNVAPVIATLPSRIARKYAHQFDLEISPVPLPMGIFPTWTVWHAKMEGDSGLVWLRAQIRNALSNPVPRESRLPEFAES